MTAAMNRTPLYDLHAAAGARFVDFAGYEMPVQYADGILAEHRWTRERAGLFDVSHMGQISVAGVGAADALETLVTADIATLAPGRQRYALMTNDAGGIIDDMMIARRPGDYLVIANASNKDAVLERLMSVAGAEVEVTAMFDRALLALQGPKARGVLAVLAPEFAFQAFQTCAGGRVAGVEISLAASGYTGEDGFEIACAAEDAEKLATAFLSSADAKWCGLGARDSLRLEAGLPLHGADITAQTNPVEAGLWFAIGRDRRAGGVREGGFPGADAILAAHRDGPTRQRVGLKVEGRAPIRAGTPLVNGEDTTIGEVTSGGFGATVDGPIAQGYVAADHAEIGTMIGAVVRGERRAVEVVDARFTPHRYWRG